MGLDLAGALAIMGTVFVGNPLSLNPGFSIGGESTAVYNILGNVLGLAGEKFFLWLLEIKSWIENPSGTPRGLLGSHNIIESDSSNTRNDIYMTGDPATMNLDLFKEWYAMSADPVGDYNMDLMAGRANIRFQQTKASNPNFYYGPFTGAIARNAGFIFAGRLLANHSKENPEGLLCKLMSRKMENTIAL